MENVCLVYLKTWKNFKNISIDKLHREQKPGANSVPGANIVLGHWGIRIESATDSESVISTGTSTGE